MKVLFNVLIFLLLLTSCEKKNPCDDLTNGVYETPELPANQQMKSDEIDEYLDLPKDIAKCISTEGLIESILSFPHLSLIFAGANPQSGYKLVNSKYRGLFELESRTDRGKYLLQKYQSRDPLGFDKSWDDIKIGHYMSTGVYLEVIQSQYINLQNLDSLDFNELFLRSLEVYELEKTELEYFDYFGLTFSTATLARMMLIRNYEPFVSLYNTNEFVFSLTEFFGTSISTIELIHELAVEYSKKIKN
jgi:hypothetical protein